MATNNYDAPFREEVIVYNGENVTVFQGIDPDSGEILIEKILLNLHPSCVVVQEANGITAPQLNNMNGKINSLEELVNQLNMITQLQGDFITNGNDNLELFGISNLARRGILNNHSDFGVLKEDAAAGVTQIKMINASGYRFDETISNASLKDFRRQGAISYNLENGYSLLKYYMANGNYSYCQIVLINPITKEIVFTQGQGSSQQWGMVDYEHNIHGFISYGSGTVATMTLRNENKNVTFISGSLGVSTSVVFYDDIDKYIYAIILPSNSTAPTLIRSPLPISKETVSIGNFTTVRTLPLWGGSSKQSNFNMVYKPKNIKYAIISYYGSADVGLLKSNYTELKLFSIGNGLYTVVGITDIVDSYLILGSNDTAQSLNADILIKFRKTEQGELDETDNGTVITVPFLNGRKITQIWSENGIAYMCGTESLLGYSIDGSNWNEIIMSDDSQKNSNFLSGSTSPDGKISLVNINNQSGGVSFYESFNPEIFKNKRYKMNSEFITFTDVELSGNDIIGSLQNPLTVNHSANEFILRTTDSTIKANSTQTVCVEMQNLYSHNAAAAKPIFTKIENVTIVPEICQRNENEVEEWVNFELVKEDDLKNGWQKNTYYKVYPQSKMIWAIAFTVTNNNESDIELNQLGIGLSNEVYEV